MQWSVSPFMPRQSYIHTVVHTYVHTYMAIHIHAYIHHLSVLRRPPSCILDLVSIARMAILDPSARPAVTSSAVGTAPATPWVANAPHMEQVHYNNDHVVPLAVTFIVVMMAIIYSDD